MLFMLSQFLTCLFLLFSKPLFATEPSWTSVSSGSATSGFRVTGHIIPQEGALHIESARVQGRVTSILRREGERVVVGTRLLTISSAECLSLREEKKVAETRHLPELINAAQKREAQLGLSVKGETCDILSQNAGTITKRNVENGSAFDVDDPVATILETGRLSVELDLPEQDIPRVKPGQRVFLELASAPGAKIQTWIQTIVPTVDPTNRTVKVRVKPVLLPKAATLDSLVFGQIDTGSTDQLLIVPTTAVVFDENKNWVIKQAHPEPLKVEVQVVSESESTSSIRAIKPEDLRPGNRVASTGAIFFFKR